MTTAATIYMSLLGPAGLETVAANSHANTMLLKEKLAGINGVEAMFNRPEFHETVLQLNKPAADVIEKLAAEGILAGFDLSADYPELGNALLLCATETKTEQDITQFAERFATTLA